MKSQFRMRLLASTLLLGASTFAAPAAFAQSTTQDDTTQAQDDDAPIVVTGSLFGTDKISASPVTTVTADDLDDRGISTVQDGLQLLSSNNGPSLTNSFTANGAFAGGASSVSLRGLSTNSTLVLFDGLRAAYYPLADDGSRNFVDLNTIPDDIVERVEVLRDGASSSYGADAIAGVVNVITKKEFKGLSGRVEAGVAEGGYGASQRLSLTAGHGSLDENGFNVYVSGFYYHSEMVKNSDLPAPFNSDDQRGIGGPNGVYNGLDENGEFTGFSAANTVDFYVRPYTNVGYADGVQNGGSAQGRYQLLNPSLGCISGSSHTLTAAELADSANAAAPTVACQADYTNQYGVVSPQIERFGGSARFTTRIGDSTEAYLAFNYQQANTYFTGSPGVIRGNAPTGIDYPRISTSTNYAPPLAVGSGVLALPVYVCPERVNCETSANRTLNPNNPFASSNQVARLVGRFPGETSRATRSRVYRAAFGVEGTVFGDWDYSFDATAMHTDLRRTTNGYVYIQHLIDVINDGTYNFVNPSLNSQDVIDYVSPENVTDASSDLYQAQLAVKKSVVQLPGGPLQVGFGGSIYYEAVDAPSANPDYNGPTERYFTLNAFGTVGNRTVTSAFGEIKAPVLDILELGASGRYDHYSSGQSNFSPKVSAKFTPIRQVALRGTYSRGFRIPSFGEANALPTTGYVSQSITNIPSSYRAQWGAACADNATAATACPTYLTSYSIGLTTLATPDLEPEKSRSFTVGLYVEPLPNVSFTVDYYHIKKTGAITSPSSAPAIAAYYAGTAIPAGYNVIADAPDVNNPTYKPKIAFVETNLINANTLISSGIDFGANGRFDFGAVRWTTNLSASLTLELSTEFPDGTKETYVDTLGNFNLTAGSGTFRWKGNWVNSFEFGPAKVTGTINYTSGYDLSAEDQGTEYRDCGLAPGYTGCRVKSYITFDLNGNVKIADHVTVYATVLNLFDRLPDYDPVTYGAYLYNPVQAGNGIFGRMFRAGAKFNF
ncbi:MAG: TonB-dependent receptor domain-containing protein [Pseudomonadota bacterium]